MVHIRAIMAEETYPIRREVLRKKIDLPYKFDGDFAKDTIHLGAFVHDELISIVTLINKSNEAFRGEQYQLRGMATLANYRGMGYGKLLALKSEDHLINKNIHKIWCNARVEALSFYRSLNYNILGDSFVVPEVGMHYLMIKEL